MTIRSAAALPGLGLAVMLLLSCGAAVRQPADGGAGDGGADDAGVDGGVGADGGCTPPRPCEPVDADGDGVAQAPCGGDCDDADPTVGPGRPDPVGDGIDSNCDGADGIDADGDGFLANESGGLDCDDTDATIHPGANDNEGWVVEEIAIGTNGDAGLAIALDERGLDHVLFWANWDALLDGPECDPLGKNDYRELHHLTRSVGGWATDALTWQCFALSGIPDEQAATSAVLSPDGAIEVAHCSSDPQGTVLHLRLANRVWTAEPAVQSEDHLVEDCALAVDSCGAGHIAYERKDDGIWYASQRPGGWQTEGIGGDYAPAIAIGPHDRRALVSIRRKVLHSDPWDLAVLLGSESGGWTDETAVSAPGLGSLAVAFPADGLEVAFRSRDGLSLASRRDGQWTIESVDPSRVASASVLEAQRNRLAIDSRFGPLIAYTVADEVGGAELRLASRAGDSWTTRRLDRVCDVDVALVTDRAGAPHIAFIRCGPPLQLAVGTLREGSDGIDQNCDGVDGVDADHDGHASRATGGDDPDDADPAR